MEYIVDEEHNGMRLDKFIRKYSKLESLSLIFSLIRKGEIKVNGKKSKENYRILKNDVLFLPSEAKIDIKSKNKTKIDKKDLLEFKNMIVFEDEAVFILNKKYGYSMHKGNDHLYGLSEIAKTYYGSNNVNFANRLDKETQGLVIGAKNLNILRKINDEIRNKKVEKKYIALIKNTNFKIGDKFSSNKKLKITENGVVVDADGLESETKFEVIDIIDDRVLLDIKLLTGRKHQIRVHLKDLGYPIIGDKKYGKKDNFKLFLKCYFIKFLKYKIEINKKF